jgi:hypothetical protein
MTALEHDREAAAHERAARDEADASTRKEGRGDRLPCMLQGSRGIVGESRCWDGLTTPSSEHREASTDEARRAEEHRRAAAELREREERACEGVAAAERDAGPFRKADDVALVEPLLGPPSEGSPTWGAVVTFRASSGLTAEGLQKLTACHLARAASVGHPTASGPACPLEGRGVTATVRSTGRGVALEIRSTDPAVGRSILERARALRPQKPPPPKTGS